MIPAAVIRRWSMPMPADTFASRQTSPRETASTGEESRHSIIHSTQTLDPELEDHVRQYAWRSERILTQRIHQLEQEWDLERHMEMTAPVFALAGIVLGVLSHRRWLIF